MPQIFAQVKIKKIVIDPGTRKPVGEDIQDQTKAFDTETHTLEDIQAWVQGLGSTNCALLFESELK